MTFDIRTVDLGKLNSLTKYPSIPTYHVLGDRGALQEQVQVPFVGRILGSEKVDGTNCRLVFCPDGSAVVGSREDLLWEWRDLIGNPAMGIVEAVRQVVLALAQRLCTPDRITVYYVEVYGHKIGAAAKNYTRAGKVGWRLFDVAHIDDYADRLAEPIDRIAHWRDTGGQRYLDTDQLVQAAADVSLELVPPLFDMDAAHLPTSLDATASFVNGLGISLGISHCQLDPTGLAFPEGVVVRSPDRSRIAKLRCEDYQRTLSRLHPANAANG